MRSHKSRKHKEEEEGELKDEWRNGGGEEVVVRRGGVVCEKRARSKGTSTCSIQL